MHDLLIGIGFFIVVGYLIKIHSRVANLRGDIARLAETAGTIADHLDALRGGSPR